MPSVTQVSSPSALTPSTMSQTASRSWSFGERQAAPMQKRLAPWASAARASASTASTAISLDAPTPVSYRAPAGSSRSPPGSRRS